MSDVLQRQRERVGRQIRKARKDAGLSHDRLALEVGTSRQHLIRLEQGQHAPRAEMLTRIAAATGKSEVFFEGEADDDEEADPVADLMHAIRRVARAEAVDIVRAELAKERS